MVHNNNENTIERIKTDKEVLALAGTERSLMKSTKKANEIYKARIQKKRPEQQ